MENDLKQQWHGLWLDICDADDFETLCQIIASDIQACSTTVKCGKRIRDDQA